MRFTRRGFMISSGAMLGAPYVKRAHASVSDESIAQMLIIGFAGSTAGSESARSLARQIAAGRAGGACFLGHNTRSREGVEALTALFASAGRRWKPFIAVDQEGGAVGAAGRAQRMNNPKGWKGAKDWLYNGHVGGAAGPTGGPRDRTRLQTRALDEMGLPHNAEGPAIRERYGVLVKQYHPDSNGGDRSMEHRLTVVIRAFKALKASGLA